MNPSGRVAMNKDEFLARVRYALHRQAGDPIGAPPDPPVASADGRGDDLLGLFTARAEAVGMSVWVVGGISAASEQVSKLLADVGAATCTMARDAIVGELAGFPDVPLAARAEDADVGITGAVAAIAETGTLVHSSETGRVEGLLPPTHIALLYEHQLVQSLDQALAVAEGNLPTAWVQATGPSRTADIELSLTTGVHGPGAVHVVVVTNAR